jgi:hypothetical protein
MRGIEDASVLFLKKRTKKTFVTWLPWPSTERSAAGDGAAADKVFLLLFVNKKKMLVCLPRHGNCHQTDRMNMAKAPPVRQRAERRQAA